MKCFMELVKSGRAQIYIPLDKHGLNWVANKIYTIIIFGYLKRMNTRICFYEMWNVSNNKLIFMIATDESFSIIT